jgi:hypothetical protein
MSTQKNQYFMYGVLLPYKWHREWEAKTGKYFQETFQEFMDDNSNETGINQIDGIFCLFDGRDGKFIIIGRVLNKSSNEQPFLGDGRPIEVPLLRPEEEEEVMNSVIKHFDIDDPHFTYYFVTKYR